MPTFFQTQSIFLTALVWCFLFIALLLSLLKSLYWTYRWQLKEYRLDRMLDFLSTYTGKKWVWNWWNTLEVVFLIIAIIAAYSASERVQYIIAIGIVLFICAETINLVRYRLRPILTAKSMAIGFGASLLGGLILLGLSYGLNMSLLRSALVAVIAQPALVALLVGLFHPITMYQRKRTIALAKEKIDRLKPVVIGVTGSYGKSSTKEALKTVLSERFNVLATPKNVNVDIGVAQTILHDLTEEHDVFIVEMGAYKKGEIAAICALVSPIIGVITAIAQQHAALFGSLEAIQDAKSELIESIPSTGLAILNRDSEGAMQVHERTEAKTRFYSIEDVAHAYASGIQPRVGGSDFTFHLGTESAPVHFNLAGRQSIPAFLAAALVAERLGMHIDEIVAGMQKAEPLAGTMHLRTARHGIQLIDDSYNANPDGFIAALDYLQLFQNSRKIVITPGMAELGDESDKQHRRVGAHLGRIADMLIITSRDYAEPLIAGAKQAGLPDSAIILQPDAQKIIETVFVDFGNDDVVLAEGRIPEKLITTLLTNV